MNRMQRKFLWVSAAVHSFLLVLLIVGPAFMPKRRSPLVDLPVLNVLPSDYVVAAVTSGATPAVTPPEPEPEPEVQPTPEPVVERSRPTPDPPKPKPVQPERKPDPVPVVVTPPKAEPKPKPKPSRKPIEVATTLIERDADSQGEARERLRPDQRSRDESRAEAVRSTVAKTMSGIKEISKSTEILNFGARGPALISYSQLVRLSYERSWIPPTTLRHDRAAVLVEIVVNHDGRIVQERILKPSGIGSLDDSVQAALDRVRVRKLPPFPDELKAQGELQKRFRINFDLQSKLRKG